MSGPYGNFRLGIHSDMQISGNLTKVKANAWVRAKLMADFSGNFRDRCPPPETLCPRSTGLKIYDVDRSNFFTVTQLISVQ